MNTDEFVNGYIMAAIFTLDREDANAEMSSKADEKCRADCEEFLNKAASIIESCEPDYKLCSKWEYAGRDFWFTRNGHGTGFWDGDWPNAEGDKLTEIAKSFGEVELYAGYDGLLYF